MKAGETTWRAIFLRAAGAAALLAAMILTGCSRGSAAAGSTAAGGGGETLVIISPHGSDIRREFGDAFSRWHVEHFGSPVEVLWPDVGGGGTGNIVRELQAAYKVHDSSGNDLIFGGGSAAFNSFMGKGFLVKPPAMEKGDPWKSDPIDAVPADVFGSPLHGNDGLWVAATMSAFGMEINKDRIAELHLNRPVYWADIAGPEWMGLLSLADPSKSGSVKTSYEKILQQYGWEKGWGILTEMFANTCVVRDSGSGPADDVGNADAVAGVVIDFFGRLQILRAGPAIAAFVVPAGGTDLDADPIALLKGAPHEKLAAEFIRFVVSEQGQRLWVLRAGTPGGPVKTALGRLSVLEDLYQPGGGAGADAGYLFDPADPFAAPAGGVLKFDPVSQQVRDAYLGDLIKSALIDNRDGLVAARRAILRAGGPPGLLEELCAVPVFRLSRVQNGQLVFGPEEEMTTGALGRVRGEYVPAEKGNAAYAERIQNALKDYWRDAMAKRFKRIEREAEASGGRAAAIPGPSTAAETQGKQM